MDKVKERTGIYHEHQEGALCAQHALNNLIQTPVFSADNLADIARELDKEENSVLTHTLIQSENMDDTGFFNIQVLQLALKMFELELISYASQEDIAKQARANPQSIQAYICNLGSHWFTLRQFGRQYFDLNSMFYVPDLIPREVLSPYLNMIQGNGYSVFVVHGNLPDCLADQQLTANPITQQEYRILVKDLPTTIMDDELIGNPRDPHNAGRISVRVPQYLYDEYKKNPNDPLLKQKILAYAPKYVIQDEIPEHVHCSNPNHNHSRRHALLATRSQREINEILMENCDYSMHTQARQLLTKRLENPMMDDPFTANSNEPHQQSHIITRVISQQIIEEPKSNNSNKSQPQRVGVTRETIIVSRSSPRDTALDNIHGTQRTSTTKVGFLNSKNDLRQLMMSDSLLGTSAMNTDANISFDENHTEKLNQQYLNATMAASLRSNNSTTKQIEETPESIPISTMNSSPTPTTNSERTPPINSSSEPIMNSSSTPTINTERILALNAERTAKQYIIEEPKSANSNQPQRQGTGVTRQMIVISRSPQRISGLVSNSDVQQAVITNIGFEDEENDMWQDMMPDSLLDPSIMNTNANISYDADRIEKLNQQHLEAAIAASLRISNSTTQPVEEIPESIPMSAMNSSSTPTMSSEQKPTMSSEQTQMNNSQQTTAVSSERTPAIDSSLAPKINSERMPTQNIIEEPKPANSNQSQRQGMEVTRQMIVINRSPQRISGLVSNSGVQQAIITNIGFGNEEDDIWQDMIPDSLLGPSIMNTNANISYDADRIEKLNQQYLEAAIADSLKISNSTTQPVEEIPESIPMPAMNTSPTPMLNSERIPMNNLEQTPTMSSEQITINNPTPSTTSSASLPINKDLSSPTVTDPDVIKSLNIEGKLLETILFFLRFCLEIRQRRLVTHGNRHKSIISQQSNFDD
ncbi:unnamed protein product [Rotaria sp. Silwood2]|nr:unnamed protein product [Rotaria sp. Silwood2]CAF4512305.1 unnamed protein product [Rotaria sp. Silwood2]